MNHGASLSMFPLAATKDLKLLQRGDLIEQILIKFDYIDNFSKDKKELPDVPAEYLENIEERWRMMSIWSWGSRVSRASDDEDHADNMLGQPPRGSDESLKLDARRNDAHGEDVKRVKDHARYLHPTSNPFSPPLSITDKVTRGFRHPQLARLICPLGWLAEFDDSEIFCQQLADGKKLAHPHDWPLFLFDEETFDMEDLFKSFLRNEILVRAWRLIFQGPSTLDGHPSPNAKRGNACINGMKKVTVAALAYVATLVYFALSSQEKFRPRGDGHTFDFYTFYCGLITCMNEDATAKDHDAILLWWNKQVFPNHMQTDNEGHANPPAQTGRGLMQAQARLRD
ncbi:hypothetical protein JB92DRAFT_3147897 [Gautieria morchelliformis]|nr:hypothetical protein JB92DRAFT_3147897 [Gautieria morchelliformis]